MAVVRDVDIRRCLAAEMSRLHAGDSDTLIVHELGLCQGTSRVDLAVVNGWLHGFEIKSDADTLQRLQTQEAAYGTTFDFVTIVTGSGHSKAAKKLVPKWWGVWCVIPLGEGLTIKELRRARRNPSPNAFSIAQLLWRDEALNELRIRGLDRGLRSKPRSVVWSALVEALSLTELKDIVRNCLKKRGERWRPDHAPLA